MKLLLIFSLLFNQNGFCPKDGGSSVRISVVSQTQFQNSGHHPENNRRIVFRLVNESDRPVVVYGLKFDGELDPTGYMMVLNNGAWKYPNPSNRPNQWSEFSQELKSKRLLKPGKAMTFVAEMSQFEVGSHFSRTAYVSFSEKDVPCEIRGEEFVLK